MKKGQTLLARTGCGKLFGTVNGAPPNQFMATIGKAGTCVKCQVSAQTALIDLALKKGVKPKEIIDALHGIRCHMSNDELGVKSCPEALSEIFAAFVEEERPCPESA